MGCAGLPASDLIDCASREEYVLIGDVERTRVDRTERNSKTRGCGIDEIEAMLEGKVMSGRCGDVTRANHRRAKLHAQEVGWALVDPDDMRKVILEGNPKLIPADETVS